MDSKQIGLFIAKKRKEKNLSQEDLASLIYVSNKTISKWENGRGIPNIDVLIPLCEILECELIELLKGKENIDKKEYNKIVLDNMKNKRKRLILDLITGILLCIVFCITEAYLYIKGASNNVGTFVFIIFFVILIIFDITNYFNNKLK